MNTRSINRKVIELLTELTDNKEVQVIHNKHIKVTGVYGGQKRSHSLCCSPSSCYLMRAQGDLRRFIRSLPIHVNPTDYSLTN